jgi:hypothetical protein
MTEKNGFAAVSRRDAIRLIAATPASGAVLATSLPGMASATTLASAGEAAARLSHRSAAVMPGATGLAGLAATHFDPLVGQTFSIGDGRATLTEVRRGPVSGARFRQQFALTFSALQHPMQSGILPVSHPAVGRHELHVTQIGRTGLEICFS